jgi:integrase
MFKPASAPPLQRARKQPSGRIIIPEQFDMLYRALPDADAQLMVETAIESGLRWGELAEFRVRDLDPATRMLTVSRKVIEVNREFHPDGRGFLLAFYPKDKEYRRLKLSAQITAKLQAHIAARGPGPDGLLFARRAAAPMLLHTVAEPGALGFTGPNAAGRRYRHGTLSAYNAGPCRRPHCRRAFADYRVERHARLPQPELDSRSQARTRFNRSTISHGGCAGLIAAVGEGCLCFCYPAMAVAGSAAAGVRSR